MAKYTLEGLEEIRKQRKLTRNEYQSYWRLKNPEKTQVIEKKASAKYYANNKEKHIATCARWEAKNRKKCNERAKLAARKKQAIKDAVKAAYEVSPEGLAELAAKKAASKEKNEGHALEMAG